MDISLVSPLGKTVTLWQEHGGSCTRCYIQSDTWDRPSAVTYERMALIHVAVAQWAPVERKRCFWDRNDKSYISDNICTHAVIVVAWVRKERVLLLFIILDILWTATHNCVCVVSFSLIEKLWWPRDTKAQNGDQMSGRFHQQPSERACRPNARRSTQFGSWCFTDGRRRCWASSSHFQHFFCAHNFKTLPQVLFDLKLMIH